MEEQVAKTGCDIQAIAEQKLQDIISNGVVDKIIEDKLTETCKSIIGEILRDYSEFGKQLKKVLTEKMEVGLDNINISSYSGMICHAIEEVMTGSILEDAKVKVQNHVKGLLKVIKKKEWKLSEIVTKYRQSLYENPELAIEVDEERYSSIWIRVGEKVKSSSYSSNTQTCEVKMLVDSKTKKINGVWHNDGYIDPRKQRVWDHSIEGFFMQLWANDCTLEIDQDEAEYECYKDGND